MSSTTSSSHASPDPGRSAVNRLRKGWPTLIVLPALIALLGAAMLSIFTEMFLSEDFGLSGGRDAPWPWAFAIIGLVAFWTSTALRRFDLSPALNASLLVVAGLVTIGAWWALEPAYDLGPVLRNPISLVNENGYFIPPLLLGIGIWYQGLRYDFDASLFQPEEIRGNVQRSWVLLAIGIVLAALIGGGIGDRGISAATVAVPVAMACSAGAVAAAEVVNTRWLASRRGSTAPGWDRWLRLFAGIVVISLVITGIAALILGPGALAAVVDGLQAALGVIGTVLYWIMFAVVYVFYWIYRGIAWIVNSIFGDIVPEVELPQQEQGAPPEQEPMMQDEPVGEPEFATLLRWIGLAIALIIAAIIIFRLTSGRRQVEEDADVDEERSSVFSASLARQQLRDLFRRKPKKERPRKLDLNQPPGSVRESMLYLQVLAERQRVGREPDETPADFTRRLAADWPVVTDSLGAIRDRYEHVRYGETADDRATVADAWRAIWQHRKDAPIPPDPQ